MKKWVILVVSMVLGLSIITGCKVKKVEEVTDAEKVALEYTISKENPFRYVTIDETLTLLQQDGILYIGYPESDTSRKVVSILTDVCKNQEITISYYNPKTTISKEQQTMLLQLLDQDEIIVPAIYVIKDGAIVAKDTSLAKEKVDYFTEEQEQQLTEKYKNLLNQ